MHDTVFGEGAIENLKEEDMTGYLTIMRDFETQKSIVIAKLCLSFVTRHSVVFNDWFLTRLKCKEYGRPTSKTKWSL